MRAASSSRTAPFNQVALPSTRSVRLSSSSTPNEAAASIDSWPDPRIAVVPVPAMDPPTQMSSPVTESVPVPRMSPLEILLPCPLTVTGPETVNTPSTSSTPPVRLAPGPRRNWLNRAPSLTCAEASVAPNEPVWTAVGTPRSSRSVPVCALTVPSLSISAADHRGPRASVLAQRAPDVHLGVETAGVADLACLRVCSQGPRHVEQRGPLKRDGAGGPGCRTGDAQGPASVEEHRAPGGPDQERRPDRYLRGPRAGQRPAGPREVAAHGEPPGARQRARAHLEVLERSVSVGGDREAAATEQHRPAALEARDGGGPGRVLRAAAGGDAHVRARAGQDVGIPVGHEVPGVRRALAVPGDGADGRRGRGERAER